MSAKQKLTTTVSTKGQMILPKAIPLQLRRIPELDGSDNGFLAVHGRNGRKPAMVRMV